jgi:aspartate carbamoyltransferase
LTRVFKVCYSKIPEKSGFFMALNKEKQPSKEILENPFRDKDFISVEQITSQDQIKYLFRIADRMRQAVEARQRLDLLLDSTVAILFYQPSTRTFTSFQAAAHWLGCRRIIAIPGMEAYSSAVKGESLPDTIRTIEQTMAADMIILRHPDDNSSEIAAQYTTVPVINAGSGRKEHPTQAILDLYTIRQELGTLDNLNVVMLGDLKNGRTIKSLSLLLGVVAPSTKITFVSPPELAAPPDFVEKLKAKGANVKEASDLKEVLGQADVLYVTRIQKEWFESEEEYQAIKGSYVISPELMQQAKQRMIVMHPLPRVDEIDTFFDSDQRAAYFRQMRAGLYTRMALIAAILGKT